MKFQIIVSDPPYRNRDQLKMSKVKRGAEANYSTLSTEELCNLPVQEIADPDGCVLALWVLGSMLEDGMQIMKAWGFEHKQVYVWVKQKNEPFKTFKKWIKKSILKHPQISYDEWSYKRAINSVIENVKDINLNDVLRFGMGHLFRQTHEICLIGTKGKKVYKKLKNKSQRSVSFAVNSKHSAKPENLQDSLDLMFPDDNIKKFEMFARRDRPGWYCAGLECPSTKNELMNDSLKRFAGM